MGKKKTVYTGASTDSTAEAGFGKIRSAAHRRKDKRTEQKMTIREEL